MRADNSNWSWLKPSCLQDYESNKLLICQLIMFFFFLESDRAVRNGWILVIIFKFFSPKAVLWLYKNCNIVHKYYDLIHIHCTAAWTHINFYFCVLRKKKKSDLRVSKRWQFSFSAELFLLCLTFKCLKNANSNVKTPVVFVHRNSRHSIMRTSCTLWDLSLSISQWDTTVRVSRPSSGWVNFAAAAHSFNGFNMGYDNLENYSPIWCSNV